MKFKPQIVDLLNQDLVLDIQIDLFPYNLIIYNVFSEYAIRILNRFKMSILLGNCILYLIDQLKGEILGGAITGISIFCKSPIILMRSQCQNELYLNLGINR